VEASPRSVRQRRSEAHKHPIRRDETWIRGEDLPARQGGRLDASEVDGRPARPGHVDGCVVDLELARPGMRVARQHAQGCAALQSPAAKRARDDNAPALDREDPVDRKGWRSVSRRTASRDGVADPADGQPDVVDPAPVGRGDRQHWDAGERRPVHERPHRVDHLVAPLVIHRIDLRDDGQPVADLERIEQGQVLERLCVRTVIGGDHQHRGIDLTRPDEHVADQLVVPRDVDEVELDPIVEREMGVADVDGHPAAPLLGEAVGVDAGERPEERGLAVVDVAGRADDDGHGSFTVP
jgi:hypothetical protein